MTARNLISCLQEYLAAKHLPLPVYEEEGFGVRFTCICRANGVQAVGHGANKKSAKQEAAKKAFDILTGGGCLLPAVEQRTTTKIIIHHQEPQCKNYVGELNEYSSKYGMNYPKYNFLTCYNTGGQFVFQCEFLGHKCEGMALNKKDAKQESAKAMLEIINIDGPKLLQQYKKTAVVRHEVNVENSEKMIHLFQSLSTTPNTCQRKEDSILYADSSIQIVPHSLELMKQELRNQNIEYKVKDLPAIDGYFVVAVILNDSDFTLCGSGKTRQDAMKEALHSVLLVKKNGCSLSKISLLG